MKLWGRKNSINVQKVIWCLGELGCEYERIDAGGEFGGTDDPVYRAMNPMGLVPALEDDGRFFWESNAIVKYLAAKHGTDPFHPADPAERAIADRWVDWFNIHLYPGLRTCFWTLIRTAEDQRNMDQVEKTAADLGRLMPLFDSWLAENPFTAGQQFTYGDIPMGAWVDRYFRLDIARPNLPHCRTWYETLRTRPAFAATFSDPMT